MNKIYRHKNIIMLNNAFEVVIKIEVKDNNIEQALGFKRKLQRLF